MPVRCEIELANVSQVEFAKLDYVVMKHVFDTQNELGRLADERIYSADLSSRLRKAGLPSPREVKIELSHDNFWKELFLDLVADLRGVYELKTAAASNAQHRCQLLTYLYLLDIEHGKLVNFRTSRVETEFVNATIPRSQRCGFEVDRQQYEGPELFCDKVIGLLRDWGTCLAVSLYQECISWMVGNHSNGPQQLPLTRNGEVLGNQRFWLLNEHQAFDVTSFSKPDDDYERQLRCLLNLSTLDAIHRINVDAHRVTFSTVKRELVRYRD